MNLNVPNVSFSMLRDENCEGQACGECHTCRRAASLAIVSYVLRKRFEERGRTYENSGAEERQYIHTTILKMLDVAGLSSEKRFITLDEIKRSEWGYAMRQRQLRKEGPHSPEDTR
jgi:hypothetical protein